MSSNRHFPCRRLATALALTLALVPAAEAQRRPNPMDGGHGGFQVGTMTLDMGALNTALVGASLPGVKQQFLSMGGMGMGGRGRWLFGGEGHALVGNEPSNAAGTYTIVATGGYGMFRIGYDLVANDAVDLYPTIGFGGGGVSVEIRGRSAPTFNDVLTTPGRSSRLASGGMVLGAGLHFNGRIHLAELHSDSTEGGMMVGVSIGYVLQPATSSWKLDQTNSVAGGPEVKIQGLTALFTFGGWGRGHRRR